MEDNHKTRYMRGKMLDSGGSAVFATDQEE